MRLDQRMQGLQCLGDGTELAGQCRKTELHTFSGITLGLPVQRLMLTVLLEGNHRQQARPRPTSRRRMERRRWLADLLTLPAGELLPDRLNHLPLPRDQATDSTSNWWRFREPSQKATSMLEKNRLFVNGEVGTFTAQILA